MVSNTEHQELYLAMVCSKPISARLSATATWRYRYHLSSRLYRDETVNPLVIWESVPVADDCLRVSPSSSASASSVPHHWGQTPDQKRPRSPTTARQTRKSSAFIIVLILIVVTRRCCEHFSCRVVRVDIQIANKDHPTHARPARTKDAGTE